MSDTVFRNPYRGRRVAKPEPYQSEHERLGAQPLEYPVNKTEANAFAEKQMKKEKKNLPKQVIVQSGQNEDMSWTKVLNTPGPQRNIEVQPTESVQEDIEDDIGLEQQETDGFGLDSLTPGQSVLIYQDNVVCVGTVNTIKETLAEILSDPNNDVKLEDLIVLKRLPLSVGIIVDEKSV